MRWSGLEGETILASPRTLEDGGNDLRLLQLAGLRYLGLAADLLDPLAWDWMSDDGAQSVDNQRDAIGARSVRVEEVRKNAERDVARHHSDHDPTHFDRITDRDHRSAGVRIDQGVSQCKRVPAKCLAVLLHGPDVEGLFGVVLRDRGWPGLVEAPMTRARYRGRCPVGIDPAHVPVGSRGDAWIT